MTFFVGEYYIVEVVQEMYFFMQKNFGIKLKSELAYKVFPESNIELIDDYRFYRNDRKYPRILYYLPNKNVYKDAIETFHTDFISDVKKWKIEFENTDNEIDSYKELVHIYEYANFPNSPNMLPVEYMDFLKEKLYEIEEKYKDNLDNVEIQDIIKGMKKIFQTEIPFDIIKIELYGEKDTDN